MRNALATLVIVPTLFAALVSCDAQSQTPATPPAWTITTPAPTPTPDQRADELLAKMTLDEKIALISGAPDGFSTKAIQRLGIPSFTMSDGPNGVRNGPGKPTPKACAFPCGAALAATWDPNLATAYGNAIGLEDRARGTNFQLGPAVNICRVPVNGRNFEYFGEDPYLAGIIATNWIKACSAQGSIPTIKHFDANNQETNRTSVDALVDQRVLEEIYLPAFKRAVQSGSILAVMCSYNRLNDHYASNNDWLLNQTLKGDWGFAGMVMSDWGASHDTTDLAKGLDLEMPTPQNFQPAKIKGALADGKLTQAELDGAIHRFLRTVIAQGWLDAGWKQKNENLPMDSADSSKVALEVAQSAAVLLKNDNNALPLDRSKVRSIVVLGPNAAAAPGEMPLNIGGGGSGAVSTFPTHFAEAEYLHGITVAAGKNVNVTYLPMPSNPGDSAYATLANARTAPDGPGGLTLSVKVTGTGDSVTIPPSVQSGINATWQRGQLPFGVPAGRNATYTWDGILAAPQDGDWQLHVTGSPTVTIDGNSVTNPEGTILHLQKDKPSTIRVELRATANPPAGRGGRRRRSGNVIRIALTPPMIPDLSPARSADAVIVCVGFNRDSEHEDTDRPFELPAIQQYLINAAAAANPRTIVVNNSGAGVGMANWSDHVAAIVQAWYLGQEGGIALGQILFGDINPSGRLISTFDRHFEDNPAYAYYPGTTPDGGAYPIEPYTEGLFYGYRGYDKAGKEPLFPFGFGLSYTTFAYSNMAIAPSGDGFTVSLDVQNTGSVAGADVVQMYVGEQNCPVERPLRELKGFAKVQLNPGETQRVQVALPRDSFAYWSPAAKGWTVDSGSTFNIEAAESERDVKLKDTVVVK
jgi:beta-glucosidase